MFRKNWFYMILMIIYLAFLLKDSLIGLIDNKKDITTRVASLVEKETKEEIEELHKIL